MVCKNHRRVWGRALDDAGINPEAINGCLPKKASSEASRHAARSIGLIPGYTRGKGMAVHTLRLICCPLTVLDQVTSDLSMNGFYPGRMDGLITSEECAVNFPQGITGTAYYLIVASTIKNAWDVLYAANPSPFVVASRERLRWVDNEEFYCAEAKILDNIVAKFTMARCADEVRQGLSKIDEYLADLANKEEAMRTSQI